VGLYSIVASDRSRADNFHLIGPGINRKTGVTSTGMVTWKVRFMAGKYRYRSDAHASLSKTFRVRP